jgi:RimJ/RimL family protein N-acetyltransferase
MLAGNTRMQHTAKAVGFTLSGEFDDPTVRAEMRLAP